MNFNEPLEWIETDGLGGFASGTVSGIRSRRYHGLLLCATRPPSGRVLLVSGIEAWVERSSARYALSAQRYAPDVVHPDGHSRIAEFQPDPWPTWVYEVEGATIRLEVIVSHGRGETLLSWTAAGGEAPLGLHVRPLLSGRDYHSLHHENPGFQFASRRRGDAVAWRPYPGIPEILALSNGAFEEKPDWYRNFLYGEEQERGLDCIEDLASPGVFRFDLSHDPAILMFKADSEHQADPSPLNAVELAGQLRRREMSRRKAFRNPLDRAADTYIVQRGSGKTIVAGYPWFTDWGRDTFIALRGLCLARGKLETARDILCEWAGAVSEGMLPNRFPDGDDPPEYNSVDASLWYVVAVHDFLARAAATRFRVSAANRRRLESACQAIVAGYAAGTRFGIRMDPDGLLAAGTPGVQLTWMDAKIGDWVVTPRIGKPVEVEALWINALRIVAAWNSSWGKIADRATKAFRDRFWCPAKRCLYDVVDVSHVPGEMDASLRPNQILAAGGLPFAVLTGDQARCVVDAVESHLWTPLGLRSLAPSENGYRGRYRGGVWDRDCAYHQGTVWPWLMGPFVEAWLRVRGFSDAARAEAQSRFMAPLMLHRSVGGVGHVSEVADGDAPHHPGGCPFQAWSLGEFIRMQELLDHRIPQHRPAQRPPRPRGARTAAAQ